MLIKSRFRDGDPLSNIGPYTKLEQAERRDPAHPRDEKQDRHGLRVPGGTDAGDGGGVDENKDSNVSFVQLRAPVCPRVTRGITARIMMAVAPAVRAWMADATGTRHHRCLKIENPRSRTPSTSHGISDVEDDQQFLAPVAKPVQRLSRQALAMAAAIRNAPVTR